MKTIRIRFSIHALLLMLIQQASLSQLSGSYSIPGDYATITAAVTDLNTVGVGGGGVTFNVAADYTESVTASILLTATGTLSDQIIFQKSGAGANPLVTRTDAGSLSTSVLGGQGDAVITIHGSDYVTFDGINVSTSDQGIEYGYLFWKVSGTNGSKNVIIKNSTVSMTKGTSAFVTGVYISNLVSFSPVSSATGVTVSSSGGRHENVSILSDTIQNVFVGIMAIGYNNFGISSQDLYDLNTIIGSSGNGNVIQNFGGNSASISHGIYGKNQNSFTVTHNAINNTSGGGSGFTAGGNGVYIESGYNENIQHNAVTLTSSSGKLHGIESQPRRGDGVASNNTVTLSQNSSFEVAQIYYSHQVVPNSITVNNNTLSYGSSISVSQSSYMIYINTTCPTVTVSGNQSSGISNVNMTSTSAQYSMCYRTASTTFTGVESITNNTFSDFNFTMPAAGVNVFLLNGIVAGGADKIISGNSVSNISINAGRHASFEAISCYLGITQQIYNNSVFDISGVSSTGSVSVDGIVTNLNPLATSNIYDNEIYDITSQGYIAAIDNGIGTAYIYRNHIYDITSTHASSVVYGLNLVNSSNVYAYNNFISELYAPSSSDTLAIRGINISSTGTKGIYNNTIYMDASSSAGSFGTTCVFANTGSSLGLRNNIFVNTSTPAGIGKTAALRFSNASLTNYSSNSDYNCFYAGTAGSANLIFYDGTNAYDTLAEFQSHVKARDRHSVTELPSFVNVSTQPYNLHINPAIATRLEGGGSVITSPVTLTLDIDDDIRNAELPDIGADEFSGTFIDETAPTVYYTSLPRSQVPTNTLNISATIVDRSGISTNPGTKPRLYFVKFTENDNAFNANSNMFNDNTNATTGWKYVEATNSSSPFNFNIDHSLLFGGSGVSTGDTIAYFFAAQDGSVMPYVETQKVHFTVPPTTVNLTPSQFPLIGLVDIYTLYSEIAGIITVGSGGDYPSLTSAGGLFSAINSGVVTSNIIVQITGDVAEDGANALNQWQELPPNSNFSVTIQPSDASMKSLSGPFTGGLIRLNGADRVTFDGRFSGSGRYLKFTNTNTSGTISVFQLISLGTNAGAINNTIRNCEISTGSNSISSLAISIGGATVASAGNDNDNITITENTIYKSIYGIYAAANSAAKNNNLQITKNIFGSTTESDYIGILGISVSQADTLTIGDNEIYNVITSLNGPIGIQISTGVVNAFISDNKIHSIKYTGSSSLGACGLDISTGVASSNITIANNVIYDIIGKGAAAMTSTNTGIRISEVSGATGGFKIYYNSVNLFGNANNTSVTQSAAMCFASSLTTGIDMRNNVFTNSIVNNSNASSGAYAVYSLAPASSFTSIDYNDYYASGSQGSFGAFSGAGLVTSLAQMQSATGKDANSLNADPLYVSDSNLVPQTGSPLISAGTAISGFTTDVTGAIRNASTPAIGAYENESALPVELVSFTATINGSQAELKWKTATELNNYGFEIEKSRIQNTEVRTQKKAETWNNVGFVEGNGSTNTPREYSFTDKNIATGKYFYRLKQIDRDGKFEYSQTVEVTINNTPKEFILEQNYPNPFNPTTNISFTLHTSGFTTLKVYDVIGREVATVINEHKESGSYSLHFNASQLASGFYVMRLRNGNNVQVRKMQLLK